MIDPTTLREYLPNTVGCNISLGTPWHHRYKVTCPRDFPPFSAGYSFGEGGATLAAAAALCLTWAWGEHKCSTRVECPFWVP